MFERLDRRRLDRETLRWYRQMYAEPNREGWGRTQARLRDMQRRMRMRGGRLLVVDWPVLSASDAASPLAPAHEAIARACAAAGIAATTCAPPRPGLRPPRCGSTRWTSIRTRPPIASRRRAWPRW